MTGRHKSIRAPMGFLAAVAAAAAAAVAVLLAGQLVAGASNEANSRVRQVAESVQKGDQKNYPDYCWFAGLENRILAEYPKLFELLDSHDKMLHGEKDLLAAVDLHKQIFRQIYITELERNVKANADKRLATAKQAEEDEEEAKVFSAPHQAAYKLFDLWANTPGDFERRQGDYANYLDSYLLQPGIQFWSYCSSEPLDCDRVLNQLITLARRQELGPVELMQISMNMIMLMNMYKADLVLDRLTSKGLIKLDELAAANLGSKSAASEQAGEQQQPTSEEEREEALQSQMIKNVATLIESDDDFNEATFFYVFMQSKQVQSYVDSKLEGYFVDRINKFLAEEQAAS